MFYIDGIQIVYFDAQAFGGLSNVDFKEFCTEQSLSYYAAPHEDFSISDAVAMTKHEGNNKLIVEDLS